MKGMDGKRESKESIFTVQQWWKNKVEKKKKKQKTKKVKNKDTQEICIQTLDTHNDMN